MNYLKKLTKSLKIIIITTTLPYILAVISAYIYTKITNYSINNFINKYLIYLTIILYIITIIYLSKKYKLKIKNTAIINYYKYLSLGISISCILNMVIYILNKPNLAIYNINFFIILISSGIIGPIYEEVIFRYIFYNKLKKFNSPTKTIIINTIIFSLIHINFIKIIYAFILGLLITITYEKKENILYPILIHIGANTISLFLTNYSKEILIISLVLFIISINVDKTYHS